MYHYFVSQSSEFCRRNPLCCFPANVYCCYCLFRYRFGPETFGYIVICERNQEDAKNSVLDMFLCVNTYKGNRCSEVTRLRAGRPRLDSPARAGRGFFLSSQWHSNRL
jgi:hypothetical protein